MVTWKEILLGVVALAALALIITGSIWVSTKIKANVTAIEEVEQDHAWCYVLSGESIDCVPK